MTWTEPINMTIGNMFSYTNSLTLNVGGYLAVFVIFLIFFISMVTYPIEYRFLSAGFGSLMPAIILWGLGMISFIIPFLIGLFVVTGLTYIIISTAN